MATETLPFDPYIGRRGSRTNPLASLADLSALDLRKPFLGITPDGVQGFDSFDDTQTAAAGTILINTPLATITGYTTPGVATIFGQGNTLNIPDGAVLVLQGIAGGPQSTIVKDLILTASGDGYIAVDAGSASLNSGTGPRLEGGGGSTAPIRFTGKGILTLINCPVASIANDLLAANQLATVYTVGVCPIGIVGANVRVVAIGGSGGATGTARDPYDVPTAKALQVIADYASAGGPITETDTSYYGKEFTDDYTSPGDEFLYACKPRRPVTTGDPTVWKWGRYLEAGV